MKETIQFTVTLNCKMTRDFTDSELEILNDEDLSDEEFKEVVLKYGPSLNEGEIQDIEFDGFVEEQSGPSNKNKEK